MLSQLFSALYSMLPSAKDYLVDGGLSSGTSAYVIIGCFIGGVIGIQLISRVLHHFIPSHVVDCDHTHEGHDGKDSEEEELGNQQRAQDGDARTKNGSSSEDTPLLSRADLSSKFDDHPRSASASEGIDSKASIIPDTAPSSRRPNLQTRLTGLVKGRKASCIQDGPCHGYSDPCAQECFRAINRSPTRHSTRAPHMGYRRGPGLLRTTTAPHSMAKGAPLDDLCQADGQQFSNPTKMSEDLAPTISRGRSGHQRSNGAPLHSSASHSSYDPESHREHKHGGNPPNDPSQSHHHHVPTNAFLSIGLQTSIAIALHKLPEGFITYATNHANPKLGFSVFMALFIHNITEGFAMALPLYLAINSRWKAIFWSSLLGGVSQPLGAGIAALWFKAAGSGANAPGETVYGCMFAITAGIMASVALQLFSESLTMTHNRNLCIGFAFLGMAILGFSFALTAS